MPSQASTTNEVWKVVNPNAAGLDIGASEIWACVPADRDATPVRCFGTFTPDLQALVAWLVACPVPPVAMESTGVYWIPIFELLEEAGLQVYLAHARPLNNLPRRKRHIHDCHPTHTLTHPILLTPSLPPRS